MPRSHPLRAKPTPADRERAYDAADGVEAVAQLIADQRECDARICDEVAAGESRSPSEKAVARMLAKRIREGRL